ncbi:MAG TPA: HIT family protein [Patescibacteria group bacterium]|nr:HIT family protein [Patescibacteria group bacterium]
MLDCLFCKIIAGEISSHKVYEDENVFAFLDIKPVNPGHVLVIPKRHSATLLETSDEDLIHVMKAIKKIAAAAMRAVGAEGFNLGVNTGAVADQVVFHTHFQIMPRFSGDGRDLWHGEEREDLVQIAEEIRGELLEG